MAKLNDLVLEHSLSFEQLSHVVKCVWQKGLCDAIPNIEDHKENLMFLKNITNANSYMKNACAVFDRATTYSKTHKNIHVLFLERLFRDGSVLPGQIMNVLNFCGYQDITGHSLLDFLLLLLCENKKGANIGCFWGYPKGCGKTTLISAIAKFLSLENCAFLNFDFSDSHFWGSNVKGKRLCIADQVVNWKAVTNKEDYFDGIIPKPIECKGLAPSRVMFPPLLCSSNEKVAQTLENERCMCLRFPNVIKTGGKEPFPVAIDGENQIVHSDDLSVLNWEDIRAFLVVGIFLRDMGYLFGLDDREQAPLNYNTHVELLGNRDVCKQLYMLYGFHLRSGLCRQRGNVKGLCEKFNKEGLVCLSAETADGDNCCLENSEQLSIYFANRNKPSSIKSAKISSGKVNVDMSFLLNLT